MVPKYYGYIQTGPLFFVHKVLAVWGKDPSARLSLSDNMI